MTGGAMSDIYDPQFVKGVFDRCGRNYRWWSFVASFGFVAIWRRQCVAALPPFPNDAPHGVDMMAGTGEVWGPLLARHPQIASITAIDISSEMHRQAVERLHHGRSDRIRHLELDALKNDLPPEKADFLISTFGMKTFNADQHARFAAEVARVLKPGGVFSIIEASDPKGWALRPLYLFYLGRVLPMIERVFLRGAEDFAMLEPYARGFGDCSGIAKALETNGLEVTFRRHFFGCATSVCGRKPN